MTTTTIIRAPRGVDHPYFMMRRETAQDSALSFEARGVLAYLLSKPDNWKINKTQLAREGGMGRDKTARIIKELRDSGYIKRQQDNDGKFKQVIFTLHELPQTEKPLTGEPLTENPQHTYKRVLQSTEDTKELTPQAAAADAETNDPQPDPPTPAELADAKPPHVAVIEDGYLATMRELGRTVLDSKRDPIKSRVTMAAALVKAGHGWRDVRGFLRWYYSDKNTDDPFWKKKAKPMPLENAAEMIPTWARKHKQRPPYRAKVAVPAPAWVKAIDEADPDVFAHEDDLAAADAREQTA